MLLNEITKKEKGTYAAVNFSNDTVKNITKYAKENNIPNILAADKFHTTLLYSRKFLPNFKPMGKYEEPMKGTPTEFDVWQTNNEDGNNTNCLVLKFDCPELTNRHKQLMKEHDALYDFPKYQTHISLSYDIGDLDISDLPDIKDILPCIDIISEYGEDLDLSWSQKNG